jgi:primosomal protein N'
VSQRRQPRPGDRVRVQFGPRVIEGTVLRVRGDYMTISVVLDDSDESIDRFVRTDALVPA